MSERSRPGRGEAAEYYFKYIDLVPDGDICDMLEAQLSDTVGALQRVPADRVDYRYAPDKWTVREVVSHLNDTERLFAFRAFWFARGFESPLPSFEQEIAMRHSGADARPWPTLVDEFRLLRGSTLLLFRHVPPAAWLRLGIASDNPFTVRALAFIGAGHVIHHMTILRERYLSQ